MDVTVREVTVHSSAGEAVGDNFRVSPAKGRHQRVKEIEALKALAAV